MAKWILNIFLGIVFSAFAILVGLFIWIGIDAIFNDNDQDTSADAPVALRVASDVAVDSQSQLAIDELLKACPGFAKYISEFEIVRINNGDDKVSIDLKINDTLNEIPYEYWAPQGHTCFTEIGGERNDRVAVAKRPCISVCQDALFEGPSSTMIDVR